MKIDRTIEVPSKHVTKVVFYYDRDYNRYRAEIHMGKRDDVLVLELGMYVYIEEATFHERKRNGDLDCETIFTRGAETK